MEVDQGGLPNGPNWFETGGRVEEMCDWYNVWEGCTLTKLTLIWKGFLLVVLRELELTTFRRTKGGLDIAEIVSVLAFSKTVW